MDIKEHLNHTDKGDQTRITALRKRLAKAQQVVGKHVPPNTSLVDELIVERRDAARLE